MSIHIFRLCRNLLCWGFPGLILLIGGCKNEMVQVRPAPGVFFVSTNGNDRWSGTLNAPNRAGTDGPFASVEQAAMSVEQYRKGSADPASATVYFRGGRYAMPAPWTITPALTAGKSGPVTFTAYPGERPVISGGRRIAGWQTVEVNGKTAWVADLPEVANGHWSFHQLWVEGRRAVRARHPNKGYLDVAAVPESKDDWTKGQAFFQFKPGDLKDWATITNAEVCVMNRWVESHLPVAQIDTKSNLISFTKRAVFKLEPKDTYYIENALELMDQPGEWYLAPSGRLYYLPLPGENPATTEVIAPVLSQLVLMQGIPENEKWVENLRFENLTFAHSEWYFPKGFDDSAKRVEIWPPPASSVGGFAQAAIGVPGAVFGQGVRNVSFNKCRLVNLGTYGIELGRGCFSNMISHCEISDLGAGGIKIGETSIRKNPNEITRNNVVSDCEIYDGGRFYHSAIGVWIGQSPGNQIVHNHIHDFYYTGISVGWTWGYSAALATNTLVAFNHVHHIGVLSNGDGPILSDMAGIYTLGLHTGSVIRNNYWHDCAGIKYGGWGIYFDEGTTGILAENNVVCRTTHGGFHQHYGKENVVRNNIFAFARDFQVQRTRPEEHRSFTFENNIVYWNTGVVLSGNLSGNNYLFRTNLYWQTEQKPIQWDGKSLADWQKKGQDIGSKVADPLFVDPAKDNFTLKPESPALTMGFRPVDLRIIGPRR